MVQTTAAPQTEPRTRVYKSHHYGWCAETQWLIGTREWDITTMKRSNGIIATHAQLKNEDGSVFLMGAPSNESFWLHRTPAGTMATEKTITEVHAISMQQFTAKKDAGELPQADNPIDIGQVLFSEGHWGQNRRAVFAIDKGTYKTVLLDGSDIKTDTHVRPIEQKHGIGTYYKTGDTIGEDDLAMLVEQAKAAITERNQKQASDKAIADQLRADKIAVGAKVLPAIPSWAQAVIVAELHRNTSDAMSDYFAHATDEVLYLAFSGHKRDLFDEMRKATLNCNVEEVRIFGTVTPTVNDNKHERTETNKDWWHPEDEHRDKYSGGSGYYLKYGHSNSSGWAISKTSYNMRLEEMQIAIAEGRYFIPDGQPAAEKVGSAAIAGKATLTINEALGGIEIKFGEGRPQDKPAEDIIEQLKEKHGGLGFNWHRGKKIWYRRIKPGMIEAATTFVNNYNANA